MTGHPLIWIGFSLLVLAVLALDLGVFHRKAHAVGFKEAVSWTGVWVTLALLFGAGVWYWAGPRKGLEFFTGYLIEYSLSADNVFVFVLIFSYFAVPPRWQHKVLFLGWVWLSSAASAGFSMFSARFFCSPASKWCSVSRRKFIPSATRWCAGFANWCR
jgi:tellurite resistance protein TerC